MQNPDIIQIIKNLKGRRDYEEKKASKLGFTSLYNYFENKFMKEKKTTEDKKKASDENKTFNDQKNKESKSCTCC